METTIELRIKSASKLIAEKINGKINIPILGEKSEQILFQWAVKKTLNKLFDLIPEEWALFLEDVNEGLEADESTLDELKFGMATFLNKKVNIPLLKEATEERVILMLLDEVFIALQKGGAINV